MLKMTRRLLVPMLLFFATQAAIPASRRQLGCRLEKLKKSETKMDFYGKMLDQDGNPVPNVKVKYQADRYGLLAPISSSGFVRTRKDGTFEIHIVMGAKLFIKDAVLDGYEYTWTENPKSFTYSTFYNEAIRHHPDKDTPVIFTIRKKQPEAVFLLKKRFLLQVNSKAEIPWCGLDLRCGDRIPFSRRQDSFYFCDLEMTGVNDKEKEEWTVTIKTNGENAGIQILDKKLYEAPEDGYAKEVTMTFKYSEELPVKHIYLRLRDKGMFARADITNALSRDKTFILEGITFINPYGDRCLESIHFRKGFFKLYQSFEEDAESSMEKHKLAPRPDFIQLIKERKMEF